MAALIRPGSQGGLITVALSFLKTRIDTSSTGLLFVFLNSFLKLDTVIFFHASFAASSIDY